jgi:enoyl-[acyl-carrier-protein] reductase (NADH)
LPIHRAGTTDDIAYGALYLASDERRYTTGHNLMIDAGITVRIVPSSKLVEEIDVRNKQIAKE